ncbi:MAG: phosphoribosylglycinamide formyltransferase, partial [Muribaculaceae bacterium]|nr:phosphoribosylglycinamide formyltransferase [Muribaculaceae bacterium]
MKKIAILCSGNGTNAEHIYDYFAHGNRVKVELVIYDRPDAPVAERMRARDVDTLFLPPEVWTDRPDEIVTLLMQRGIDLVVLAGFLRHVPDTITRAFTGRMLNIHPSLLPAYSGKGMYGRRVHEAVIAAGDRRSGATVHYVTDRLDAGEILMQEEVEVSPDDTPESLEQKVHEVEYSLYPRAIMAALGCLDNIAAAPQPAASQP